MNKFITKLAKLFLGISMAAGVGVAIGADRKEASSVHATDTTTTYTFTSNAWAATPANWTSGKNGNGFTTGQGVQVTTGTTGANCTSPKSFSNVSKIVVTYNTNKSKGAGSIEIKIGSNTAKSNSVAYSTGDGTSANYTTQFDYATKQSGTIKLTVNTTTNSIWPKSIAITESSDTQTPSISLNSSSFSGYTGQSFSVTATFANLTSQFAWSTSGSGTTTETINTTGTTTGTSTYSGTLTGSGTKTLNATGGGATTQSYTVTITQTTLDITKSSTLIGQGRNEILAFTHNASSVDGVTWTSNNEKVTVDSSGKVSVAADAEIDDTAIITATSNVDSNVSDTCTVTVIEAPLDDYSYTFTTSKFTNGQASSSAVLSDSNYSPTWAVALNGTTYCATSGDGEKSQQFGSGSVSDSFTLTTSSFSNAITNVTVNGRAKTSATMAVTVGGATLGSSKSVGTSYSDFSFDKTGSSFFTGTIVISVTGNTGYFYLKSISISFEKAQTIEVESIELGDPISLAKGQTTTILPTVEPDNASDQSVSFEVTASDPSGCVTVNPSTGLVTAVNVGTATITGTSNSNSSATDTVSVEVTAAIPTSLSWTKQNKKLAEGETLGSYFTNSMNVLTVNYTDSTTLGLSLGSSGLVMTLGSDVVTSSYVLTTNDDAKVLKATYTEGTTTVSQQVTLQISPLLTIDSISKNYTGGKDYILSDDLNSTLTVSYSSLNGQPEVSAVSSNEDVLLADADTLVYDSENKTGTFNVTLLPEKAGTVYISLIISFGGHSISLNSDTIIVRSSDPITTDDKYEKVTSLSDINSDDTYLIVNEANGVALDGSLETIDGANDYISITFSGDDINSTASTRAAEFKIDKTNGYLQSCTNEYYIYGTSGSNKLNQKDTTEDVLNSFSFDASHNFIATSYTSILCWNNAVSGSGGQRFRYAKSGSTMASNGWCYVQLYKFVPGEAPTDDESIVLTFITNYMHPEVTENDKGSGSCKNSGWYTAARLHIESDLDNTQRLMFRDDYNNYYLRLQAWARANTTTFVIENSGAIAASNAIQPINVLLNNTNTIAIIVITSMVSVTAIGGYFFLRKRKEQ